MTTPLTVRRIAYALGAAIGGVDLRATLDDETIATIRAAWLEHQVLIFPGQALSRDELLAFAARFGELEQVGLGSADPDRPNLTLVTERALNGKPWHGYKGGQNWHSDKSFTLNPTTATFLACKETPKTGGDTMFADTYGAYATLSPAMRQLVDGLFAIHDYGLRLNAGTSSPSDPAAAQRALEAQSDLANRNPPAVHAVARVHPETGRTAIYLGDRVRRFAGLREEESKPLLDFLNAHCVRYEATYRHRWSVGDLVMWDNRCTLHIALSDYNVGVDPRFMHRCALKGAPSGRRYDPVEDAVTV